MVQAYVPHEGDLWAATRDAVESFLHDVEAETAAPELDASGHGFLLGLSRREAPASAVRLAGRVAGHRRDPGSRASARCIASWPPPTRPSRASRRRP